MTNRLMTAAEVIEEIIKPLHAAFLADLPGLYDEARAAFSKGRKVYKTHYYGIAVKLRPADLPQN